MKSTIKTKRGLVVWGVGCVMEGLEGWGKMYFEFIMNINLYMDFFFLYQEKNTDMDSRAL